MLRENNNEMTVNVCGYYEEMWLAGNVFNLGGFFII